MLDMGEPVAIVDLAEQMIRRAGLRPYVDLPIVFTGIRPGEKLFEELDVSEKSAFRTGHARIFICRESTVRPDVSAVMEAVEKLLLDPPPVADAVARVKALLNV